MSKINEIFEKLRHKKDCASFDGSEASTSSGCISATARDLQDMSGDRNDRSFLIAQTLDEVLQDSVALSYYINFLENSGQGVLNLIKFWLHIEGYKASCSDASTESLKRDASNILCTYLANDTLNIPEKIKSVTKENINHLNDDGRKADCCFELAQLYVWDLMLNRYFKEFIHSNYYAKYQLEILQTQGILLQDILRSHQLLSAFIEFLEEIGQRNLLEFVIAVDSFVAELNESEKSDEYLQDDAIVIYDRYFSMQAMDPLEFGDDNIRVEVEGRICTIEGRPRKDAFERPKRLALTTLQQKLIPSFLKSNYLKKITGELKRNIENHEDILLTSHERNINGTRSNHRLSNSSLPTSSTTASSGPHGHGPREQFSRNKFLTCGSEHDYSSGYSRSVMDGGETSKRRQSSSLAKIDQFGRYIPLFDNTLIIDDSKFNNSARNRLKNTLDRYLNQAAAKESLVADEIAELIINDVQKMVAIGNNNNNPSRSSSRTSN